MEFRAIAFKEFAVLPERFRALLVEYFGVPGEPEAAEQWLALTRSHDDWAAALLSVAGALSRVSIRTGSQDISGLDLVEHLHLLAGDRLYVHLSRSAFDGWRPVGQFQIRLANGASESGRVQFNRGQLGASLHRGFDIQGVTALNRIPRIQWNYRLCDGLADIDLDGFSPWDPGRHLTYANSDPRQWLDRYKQKFGDAGYSVESAGNVPELRLEDESVCPNSGRRLSGNEQAEALAEVTSALALLAATNDFRAVVEASRARLEPALRDAQSSPLEPEVDVNVRLDATSDDLLGYYAARMDVERLARAVQPVPDVRGLALTAVAADRTAAVSTTAELAASRRALEEQVAVMRVHARALDRPARLDAMPVARARAWLSIDDESAFGYPAQTRFVAAETHELQFLFAPAATGYELLFAVPRTKF
jgi:hypothetical protein